MTYETIDDAIVALGEAIIDTTIDHGEAAVEAGFADLVRSVAENCTPDVREELLRRNGLT